MAGSSNYPTFLDAETAFVDNTTVIIAAHPNDNRKAIVQIQAALGGLPVTGIIDNMVYSGGLLAAPNVLGGHNGIITGFPSNPQVGWASVVATQLRSLIGGASYRTQPAMSLASLVAKAFVINGVDATLTGAVQVVNVLGAGALGSRPASASGNNGWLWFVSTGGDSDSPNGSVARSNGTTWRNIGFYPQGSSPAHHDLILFDDSAKQWIRFGLGANGTIPRVVAGALSYVTLTAADVSAIPTSLGVALGDLLVFNGTSWGRLPLTGSGQVLTNLGGTVSWAPQAGVMLSAPAVKGAATWTQYGSIQAAITAAVNGEKVVIPPGTYVENITLKTGVPVVELIPGTVTIQSGTAGAPTVTTAVDSTLIVDRITSTQGVTGTSEYPVLASHASGTCYIKARSIDCSFTTAASQTGYGVWATGAGTTILDVDQIEVISSGASASMHGVRAEAGTLYLYANRIIVEVAGATASNCYGVRLSGSVLYGYVKQLSIESTGPTWGVAVNASSTAEVTLGAVTVTTSDTAKGLSADDSTANLAVAHWMTATSTGGSGYGVEASGTATVTVRTGTVSGTTYDLRRLNTAVLGVCGIQYDPAKTSGTITLLQGDRDTVDVHTCNGRLTLTTAVPVTTADVTAATTVYFTPHNGNQVAIRTGTVWKKYTFAEVSLSLSGWTADKNSDIFIYDNAGTLALERAEWTNDTTRATALVLQDGVWCKSGALTRRYLGTIRTTGTTGQTEDSATKRFVWNMYNRMMRPMRVVDTTDSWTYTTATWRSANGSDANRVAYVVGLNEDPVRARVKGIGNNGAVLVAVGVGVDATDTNSAQMMGSGSGFLMNTTAEYQGFPGIGYHFLQWLEISQASGTTTWYGDNGLSYIQSGMIAEVMG